MDKKNPTEELYKAFTKAYNFFNEELFKGELSPCMVTVARGKPYYGCFMPKRWKDDNGQLVHEISMNTAYFHEQSMIEVFQTLVHEMCHLWQFDYGKPSRNGYHNKEWANKMESIGLIPSDTFKEGGARTGQKMGDYPQEGGAFQAACEKLAANGYFFKWIDRTLLRLPPNLNNEQENQSNTTENKIQAILAAPLINFNPDDVIDMTTKQNRKHCYLCPCGCRVWGRKDLNVICGRCGAPFEYQLSGGDNSNEKQNQE